MKDSKTNKNNKQNSLFTTAKSVSAAFFGVQSNQNREQDFNHGKISHFIIVGILGVVVFVGILIVVVSIVIPSS